MNVISGRLKGKRLLLLLLLLLLFVESVYHLLRHNNLIRVFSPLPSQGRFSVVVVMRNVTGFTTNLSRLQYLSCSQRFC